MARAAGSENLQFRDLRRESISRLFERHGAARLTDEEIIAMTGHIDRTMLRIYVKLRTKEVIARAFGVANAVPDYVPEAKLTEREQRASRGWPLPLEALKTLADKHSKSEIGRMFGVSEAAVRKALKS